MKLFKDIVFPFGRAVFWGTIGRLLRNPKGKVIDKVNASATEAREQMTTTILSPPGVALDDVTDMDTLVEQMKARLEERP